MDPRLFCAEWCRLLGTTTLEFALPFTADGKAVTLLWQNGTLSLTVDGRSVSDESHAVAMFKEMMR